MDIDGLGEENARRFLEMGLIESFADVYDLTVERLTELDRFGETSAGNLVAAIEASKASPSTWCSTRRAAGHRLRQRPQPGPPLPLDDALLAASEEELTAVEGMARSSQPPSASRWTRSRCSSSSRSCVRGLQMEEEGPAPPAEGPLVGKTLVLTGTLPNLTRPEATARVDAAGGKVTGSVSTKTDYVVAGEDPGTKLTKAQELGTAILDEEGRRALLSSAASRS